MRIVCQSCSQILPKTALLCPKCGCREFLPENSQHQLDEQKVDKIFDEKKLDSDKTIVQDIIKNNVENHSSINTPLPVSHSSLPPKRFADKKAYNMQYAGVFIRASAFLIDVVFFVILCAVLYHFVFSHMLKLNAWLGVCILSYFPFMAMFCCTSRQATIGKMIMKLWVFDMKGRRIGFFHALLREMIKILLFIFFWIAWFSARKQNLADIISRTVVLYDPT